MSLVGFKAINHPQQVGKNGARDDIDDRGTKNSFIDDLEARFGVFDLDVAAAPHNAKAGHYYDVVANGLARPWWGNVWCNPPYSDCGAWVRKAWSEWRRLDRSEDDVWTVMHSNGRLREPETSEDRAVRRSTHINHSTPVRVVEHGHGRVCTQSYGRGPWTIHQVGEGELKLIRGSECDMHRKDSPPTRITMLLPNNRVEQAWWQDLVEPYRDRPGSDLSVTFLRGRMRFDRPNAVIGPKGDRPPFGCCLLIWEAS